MLKRIATALAFAFCAPVDAQERSEWSPFFVEDRITMSVEGHADISNLHLHLEYAFQNVSGERIELLLIGPDGQRWELGLEPRGTDLLVVDAPLELAHPTPATMAFRAQTYLTVYQEDADERILVPAEITSFAFELPLQDTARILTSSIPLGILAGEVVADRILRALPAVQVVLTTAPEQIEINVSAQQNRGLSATVRNIGQRSVNGLVLTAIVETTPDGPVDPEDPWRLTGDDGVMLRWEAALPELDGGGRVTVNIPGISANEKTLLRRLAVHNADGDLVAVD